MVLDNSKLGATWHLQFYDPDTRRLCYMLLLPLFEGVFATLLISGYTESVTSMLNVAFTIFAGAGAATEILAPTFESLLYLETLKIVSGLAVAAIALQIAEVKYSEKIPVPLIVFLGLVFSIRPNPSLTVTTEHIFSFISHYFSCISRPIPSFMARRLYKCRMYRKGEVAVLLIISASLLGANIPSEVGLAMMAVSLAASIRY